MPLPLIPIIAGATSLIAGALGVKKGLDAKGLYEQAKSIGGRAERRHREAVKEIEDRRTSVYEQLQALGRMKADAFSNTARYVVDQVRQARAVATLSDVDYASIPEEELVVFERESAQMSALDLVSDAGTSAALAALGAGGTYAAVGAAATASTGTAIASLSGAAATNATLAWLGGGSLATGGLGIAGGMWVLSGIVAGPALAITGFSLASRAEEAVTQAQFFAAEVDEKIAELQSLHALLDGTSNNINETEHALESLLVAFENARSQYEDRHRKADQSWSERSSQLNENQRAQDIEAFEFDLQRIIVVFKAIKEVVQTPLLDETHMPIVGLRERLSQVVDVCDSELFSARRGDHE
ncbi:MAG: hypothetical protein KJZ96_14225 [Rhodocyclaceae bacterium]|nr:hypothetical protein [Rhodocyclaceae bacterium]